MDSKFNPTKDRSAANSKYEFQFIGNASKAVVPILQCYQSGHYRIIGTGSYFIKPNIFITAAHLFKGEDINTDDLFHIIIEGVSEPVPIVQKHIHEYLDIAILVLDEIGKEYLKEVNPLAVMNLPPMKSEIVAIYGYSHSIIDPKNTFTTAKGETMQHLNPRSKWEIGGIMEIHDSGTRLLKGECYETSVLAEGRDSGAPLFNSNGFLVGILSTSWSFNDGLPNSLCSSVLELAEIPIDGTPIKNLWNKKPRAVYCKMKSQANKYR